MTFHHEVNPLEPDFSKILEIKGCYVPFFPC
jgi:hypothetical protein